MDHGTCAAGIGPLDVIHYGGWGKLSNGQLSDGSQCLDFFRWSLIEGQELADDDTARRHAALLAEKLKKNGSATSTEKIVVTNERDEVVHTQPLRS